MVAATAAAPKSSTDQVPDQISGVKTAALISMPLTNSAATIVEKLRKALAVMSCLLGLDAASVPRSSP